MPLPRPANPRVLWNDIRALVKERPRHQWVAGLLSVMIPVGIIVSFYFDAQTNIAPPPRVIYVESWSADRTDEEIKARQKADQEEREALQAERQRQFQRLDDQLKRLGI